MGRRAIVLAFAAHGIAVAACTDLTAPRVTPEQRLAVQDLVCKPPTPDSLIPLPIAPPSARVDLYDPVFSNSTSVTNPLFPISNLHQAILVGAVDGQPLHIETTLMPNTIPVDMGTDTVVTLGSSFLSIVGRRIEEYALDRYAQDDSGSVWYFGEDVFDYQDGKVIDTEGTWLACKDGPAAMIMHHDPQVGQVWRTENIFGVAFEEITVEKTNLTLPAPRGTVSGGIRVTELHMEGDLEPKWFAPGYGEFHSGTDPENHEATALAIPVNALPGPTPPEIRTILTGGRDVFELARAGEWGGAASTVSAMNAAWASYRSIAPRLIEPLMTQALADLTHAVANRYTVASAQAAIDVDRHALDLDIQYRDRTLVDVDRIDLWNHQMVLDAEANDQGGVLSDLAIIGYIMDRLDSSTARQLRAVVTTIKTAADRRDFASVRAGSARLENALGARG